MGHENQEELLSPSEVLKCLTDFVKYFDNIIEMKFELYSCVYRGTASKSSGKWNALLSLANAGGAGSMALASAGAAPLAALVGTFGAQLGIDYIKRSLTLLAHESYKKDVRKIYDVWLSNEKTKDQLREEIIRAGIDIFQSFELQFIRVYSHQNRDEALLKLAEDAADRITNYLKIKSDSQLIEAFINGKSKSSNGFQIKYKFKLSERKWYTTELFDKAQIINDNKYFGKKKANLDYGFRRLFKSEVDKWNVAVPKGYNEMKPIPEKMIQFTDYQYITCPSICQEQEKKLLKEINEEDENLSENRLMGAITNGTEIISQILKDLGAKVDCGLLKPFNNLICNIEEILRTLEYQRKEIQNTNDSILNIISENSKKSKEELSEILETTIKCQVDQTYVFKPFNPIDTDSTSNFQVLRLVPSNIELVRYQIRQAYSKKFKSLYILLSDLMSFELDFVKNYFYDNNLFNILIIECNTEFNAKLSSKYERVLDIFTEKNEGKGKSIILIINEGEHFPEPYPTVTKTWNLSTSDLTYESEQKIFDTDIKFQGYYVKLKNIISLEKGPEKIDSSTLLKLIRDESFTIGNDFKLTENVPHYLPRSFIQRIEIRKDFLRTPPSGIIAISNITQTQLNEITSLRYTSQIHNFHRDTGYLIFQIVVMKSFQELYEIADERKVGIHWLEYANGKLFWKGTRGKTDDIYKFIATDIVSQSKFFVHYHQNFSSYVNIEKIVKDKHRRSIVICNTIGGGSTTEINNLALKIKEHHPHLWVLKIDLNECTPKLLEMKKGNEVINLKSAIEFVLSQMQAQYKPLVEFERQLLEMYFEKKKVVILFDSFDKICPDYEDLVLQILSCLEFKLYKLIVATRINFSERLENKLGVFSYLIINFTKKQRIEYFENYWKIYLNLVGADRTVKLYADKVFDEISKIGKFNDFITKTPLLLRLVADLFMRNDVYNIGQIEMTCNDVVTRENEKARKCSTKKKANKLEPPVFIKLTKGNFSLDFFDLIMKQKCYKYFWEDHIHVDFSKPPVRKWLEIIYNDFMEKYQFLALNTLLSDEDFDKLTSNIEKKKFEDWKCDIRDDNEGLIEQINDNKLIFIHSNIPQYLVAKLLHYWLRDDKRIQPLVEVLIGAILVSHTYSVLRKFFNLELQMQPLPPSCVKLFSLTLSELWSQKSLRNRFFNSSQSTFVEVTINEKNKFIFDLLCDALKFNPEYLSSLIANRTFQCTRNMTYTDERYVIEVNNKMSVVCPSSDYQALTANVQEQFFQQLALIAKSNSNEIIEISQTLTKLIDEDLIDERISQEIYSCGNLRLIQTFESKCEYLHLYALHFGAGCSSDNVDVVRWLVNEKNVDVENMDRDQQTALQIAVRSGNIKITEFLGEVSNMEVLYDRGYTLLHKAVELGNENMVKVLVKKINVNTQNFQGETALHIAARFDYIDIIKILLENRADCKVTDTSGRKPHSISFERHESTYKFFVSRGAEQLREVCASGSTYIPSARQIYQTSSDDESHSDGETETGVAIVNDENSNWDSPVLQQICFS